MRSFFLILLLPIFARAQTVREVGSGYTYSTVASAVAAANPNDIIQLHETMYEAVTINKSNLTFKGAGITGFQTKTSWTNVGNGIWETPCTNTEVRQVLINGVQYDKGKSPIYYAASNTSYSITGGGIPDASSVNYTGAEVVFHPEIWIWERMVVQSHTGTTITMRRGPWSGTYTAYGASLPYFLQNSPSVCNDFGEWYYDSTAKKMGVYFGGNNPNNYDIKVSELEDLVTVTGNNVVFDGMAFTGANGTAVKVAGSGVSVNGCTIQYAGHRGMFTSGTSTVFTSNVVDKVLSEGIWCEGNNAVINNNTIKNISLYTGQYYFNGDWSSIGAVVKEASNVSFQHNKLDNIGYSGLLFYSSPYIQIKYNEVSHTNQNKLDGAGIYTLGEITNTNARPDGVTVAYNIVHDCGAHGFYTDDNSNGTVMDNNTAYNNAGFGYFCHNSRNITFTHNKLYNNTTGQFYMWRDGKEPIIPVEGMVITNNEFVSAKPGSVVASFQASWNAGGQAQINATYNPPFTHESMLQNMGVIDNNIYAVPFGYEELAINCQNEFHSIDTWKDKYHHDNSSTHGIRVQPYIINSLGNNLLDYGTITDMPAPIRNEEGYGYGVHYWNSEVYAAYNNNMSATKVTALDGDALKIGFSGTNSYGWDYGTRSYKNGVAFPLQTNTIVGDKYLIRFSAKGDSAFSQLQMALRDGFGPYQDKEASNVLKPIIKNSRGEFEYYVTGQTRSGNYLMFNILNPSRTPVYLDNVQVYHPDMTMKDPANYFRLETNPGASPISVSFGPNYKDMAGNVVSSATIPAGGSILVINDASGNVTTTPAPPTVNADDNANTLSASHALGNSEILVSENGGAFVQYTGIINVGDVDRPAGYWKFKIKSGPGRNESAVAESPAFISSGNNVTPAPPTVTADDYFDVISATHPLGTSEILISENNAQYVPYWGITGVGDVDRPVGYWKFKIKSAPGRNESAVAESPAFTTKAAPNVTPAPPTIIGDDNTNTLSAIHSLGNSEILVSENGGAYSQYTGVINVGNVTRAAGYWKFKIKSAPGRNESAEAESPAFTTVAAPNVTPDPPTILADDYFNTISATHALGTTEILVSENNAPFVAYGGIVGVGNVDRPVGYWKYKIRSAPGRNESAVAESPAFTATVNTNITPDPPTVIADDYFNTIQATHALGASEILVSENNAPYVPYWGISGVGNVARPAGYWKYKIKSAPGRNESAVTESPAFTFVPDPPSISGDDNANTLSASHALGSSEILVSENGTAFAQYNGTINVGDVDRPAGYWKFKIKSAADRTESAISQSPAFSKSASANVTPDAPTVNADDYFNTISATHVLGASEILVSENNAAYVPYWGITGVGNVARPAGYWKYKIKSAPGRNESAVAESPAFTFVPDPPSVSGDDNANTLSASHALGSSEILVSENGAAFVQYNGTINVGDVDRPAGYWKFKIKSTSDRTESATSQSPAFSKNASANVTPDPPTVIADDYFNTIQATHALGTSEILVSENNAPYVAYWGITGVGDVARPAGYWKYKIKSAPGRNESAVAESPAFTQAAAPNVTPAPPTIHANDTTNTLSATHALGNSEVLVSENGGAYVQYNGTINVGNVARPAGYWKFKIKSAPGRNESAVSESPAFTVNPPPTQSGEILIYGNFRF